MESIIPKTQKILKVGLIQSHDSSEAESFLLLVAEREFRKSPSSEKDLVPCPYWLERKGLWEGKEAPGGSGRCSWLPVSKEIETLVQ